MTDDRERAEQALKSLSGEQPASWPAVAERIRVARLRAGLTEAQVAERAGLRSASEYWDLELHDDEAFTNVSVAEFHRIAVVLGTTGSQLLFGEEIRPSADAADFATISARLAARVSDGQTSAGALGEIAGWDIAEVVQNPAALATFNVVGLRDVCRAVSVDWVGAFLSAGTRPPNDEMQRTSHG